MLKPLAIGACLAWLSACAATPTTPAKSQAAAAVKPPVGCVAQTATHIPAKPDQCAGFGSTYTQEDLDRTGQTTVDRALGMLDPSVRIGR